ncbi:hypothetical protein K1X13_06365 [Nocardioides sp. WL0053]|uniref:Uncharacterized protein n=1 Tax=Nocardioides jiangsuensis TaxID=2866161 RepID=A0ABS7RLL6_9ACTN|nr:hypothetical protein [Nocardioides jiangsuensis]MBY9074437.1 hypothetical protein [Nocardioides jiangsuensis]
MTNLTDQISWAASRYRHSDQEQSAGQPSRKLRPGMWPAQQCPNHQQQRHTEGQVLAGFTDVVTHDGVNASTTKTTAMAVAPTMLTPTGCRFHNGHDAAP